MTRPEGPFTANRAPRCASFAFIWMLVFWGCVFGAWIASELLL